MRRGEPIGDYSEVEEADEARPPTENRFSGLFGMLREYMRQRFPVEFVLVWRLAGENRKHFACKASSVMHARELAAHAMIRVERSKDEDGSLEEASELEVMGP